MIRSGHNDPSKYKCWKLFRATLSVHNLPFSNKKLAKRQAGPASSECTFYDKTLENAYVCNEHFTLDCCEVSYRYKMLGAKKEE